MKKYLVVLLFFLPLTLMPNAGQAEPRRVILNDGTEIIGELVSLQNGSYTIRSKTLGVLTVSERQIASITSLRKVEITAGSAAQQNPIEMAEQAMASGQLQNIQQSLMNNSDLLQQILMLQTNPDVQDILKDPEIMAAIQRLDFDALRGNPRIQKLMQNSEVKSITGQVN